ncbi:MAG: hypothetical protein ACFFCW_00830 [Candidatus Hodarchaeota archaeon]
MKNFKGVTIWQRFESLESEREIFEKSSAKLILSDDNRWAQLILYTVEGGSHAF